MRYFNMYLVNAFTNKTFNGNVTGVVLANKKLEDKEMQNIAKDLNQSETVFVKQIDTEIFETRFFTPTEELNLCGHATIATFYAIAANEYLHPIESGIREIVQLTKCCKVPVELEYEDYKIENVYMILCPEERPKEITNEDIIDALNLNPEDIGLGDIKLEPKKISTGAIDVVIPVKSIEILQNIKPNYEKIYNLSKSEKIISFQVFTVESEGEVRQRTFSPSIGVNEEAGSGTSTGATMFYLNQYVNRDCKKIRSTQGVELNRTSTLSAELISENKVRVGGGAYVFMNGVINI